MPGGSGWNTAGSSVGRPSPSSSHVSAKRSPAVSSRADMPLVVTEVEMSISIGSPPVGMPMATGFGVNTASRPPCGATEATEGSEEWISTISPSRAGASR